MTETDHETTTDRESHGPYTFDYNDDADRVIVTDANGTTWPFPHAGMDATWPAESDVTVTPEFCRAIGGHAYHRTGTTGGMPPRAMRECKLCGHDQIEKPQRWVDADG